MSNSAYYEDVLIASPSCPTSKGIVWQAFEMRLDRGKFLKSLSGLGGIFSKVIFKRGLMKLLLIQDTKQKRVGRFSLM